MTGNNLSVLEKKVLHNPNNIIAMYMLPCDIKIQSVSSLGSWLMRLGVQQKQVNSVLGDKLLWIVTGTGDGEGNAQFAG